MVRRQYGDPIISPKSKYLPEPKKNQTAAAPKKAVAKTSPKVQAPSPKTNAFGAQSSFGMPSLKNLTLTPGGTTKSPATNKKAPPAPATSGVGGAGLSNLLAGMRKMQEQAKKKAQAAKQQAQGGSISPLDAMSLIPGMGGIAGLGRLGLGAAQDPSMLQQEQDVPMFGKSLSDYLSEAGDGSGLISSQLAALEAERARGRGQQQKGDADIAAMYAALQNSLRGDQATTAQRYTDAQAASQASTNQANSAIQNAQQQVAQSQDQTLANLGISDAGQQAERTQGEYHGMNTGTNAIKGDANVQNLISGGQGQQNLLQSNISAAGFQGASRRADLQTELMDYLSNIGNQEATLRDNARQQAQSLAQSRYGADSDAFYREQDYRNGLDDRAYNRGMDADQRDLQWQQFQAEQDASSNQAVDPSKLRGNDSALYYLQQAGVAPQDQQVILQSIYESIGTSDGGKTPNAYAAGQKAIASNPNIRNKNAAYSALWAMLGNKTG